MTKGTPSMSVGDATERRPVAVYAALGDDVRAGVAALEAAGFRVVEAGSDDPEVLAAAAPEAVALLIGYGRVNAAVLEALPQLQVVSLISQGHDNVDVAACARAGVQVAHLPPVATEEVATHAWMLTLAAVRQLGWFTRAAREAGRWELPPPVLPRRMSELRVGVVGTGATAARYAALAAPVVREVASWSRSGRRLDGVRAATSLEELLAVSDVVSLHVPLDAGTRHLVDDTFLAAMPRGSWLVNVARGGLVDPYAVARALDRGHLAGAALDVLAPEPAPVDHPLLGRDDVLITPHVAWMSAEALLGYVLEQAANVIAWLQTGAVTHPVLP